MPPSKITHSEANEPLWPSVEGALRYVHRYENHPVWRTSQALARLTGSTVPGRNSSGLTEWDHHIQACMVVRLLRRHLRPWHWTVVRAYYLPLTEHGIPDKEVACARVADQLLEYLDDVALERDWIWDLVRGWAGLPMHKTHADWARQLMRDAKTLRRHRFGSAEIEGAEEVLEQWRGEAKGAAAGPLRETGLVGGDHPS